MYQIIPENCKRGYAVCEFVLTEYKSPMQNKIDVRALYGQIEVYRFMQLIIN